MVSKWKKTASVQRDGITTVKNKKRGGRKVIFSAEMSKTLSEKIEYYNMMQMAVTYTLLAEDARAIVAERDPGRGSLSCFVSFTKPR